MKKILIYLSIAVVIGGASFAGWKYFFGEEETLSPEEYIGTEVSAESEEEEEVTEEKKTELEETLEGIEKEELKLNINKETEQATIVRIMHEMVHQKVKAEEKWGRIPMHPETIDQVYNVISDSNFENKDELLLIAERWKDGDFDLADYDHNYLWSLQGGTIGKAYGKLTISEEINYIKESFYKN